MKLNTPSLIRRSFYRLQSVIKTDLGYLLKGGFFLTLGQIIAMSSGLLLTLGLVKILNQAEYGLYTYILSVAGIVAAFTLSGVDTAVAQAIAKGFDRALVHGFWAKLRWGIPASLVTFCIGAYYLYNGNHTLGISFMVIAILSPLLHSASLYSAYFNGKKKFGKIAADNALKNITITACMLIVAYLTKDVIYIICAFFLSNTLISLTRYLFLMRKTIQSSQAAGTFSLSLGKHLSVIEAFSMFATYIDKILVFQLLGAAPLALYALALAPVKQVQNLSKIVRALVLPRFSIRTAAELKGSMFQKSLLFLAASLAIMVVYWVLAELLFTYVLPEYHEALFYSQVLSLCLLFMPTTLHVQAFTTLEKKKELYILNITKPITKVVLCLILVHFYGIWGIISAFLITHVTHAMLILFLFRNIDKENAGTVA